MRKYSLEGAKGISGTMGTTGTPGTGGLWGQGDSGDRGTPGETYSQNGGNTARAGPASFGTRARDSFNVSTL